VVYPLIEESERLDLKNATDICEELKRIFPHFNIQLLHGRMKVLSVSFWPSIKTDEAKRRLTVMEKTADGFRIAEEDLAIRGYFSLS